MRADHCLRQVLPEGRSSGMLIASWCQLLQGVQYRSRSGARRGEGGGGAAEAWTREPPVGHLTGPPCLSLSYYASIIFQLDNEQDMTEQ